MHNYDKVVIFKLGKFFEAYFDDAITVHELLGYELDVETLLPYAQCWFSRKKPRQTLPHFDLAQLQSDARKANRKQSDAMVRIRK